MQGRGQRGHGDRYVEIGRLVGTPNKHSLPFKTKEKACPETLRLSPKYHHLSPAVFPQQPSQGDPWPDQLIPPALGPSLFFQGPLSKSES